MAANSNFELQSHPQAYPLAGARMHAEAYRRYDADLISEGLHVHTHDACTGHAWVI